MHNVPYEIIKFKYILLRRKITFSLKSGRTVLICHHHHHHHVVPPATPFPGLLHFTLDPYLILLSVKERGIKYHFKVFGMTRPGIELRSPGSLANTLSTGIISRYALLYIQVILLDYSKWSHHIYGPIGD